MLTQVKEGWPKPWDSGGLKRKKEQAMSYRVILSRLNGTPSDNAVLNGALTLSRAFGGHIEALFSQPDPRTMVAIADDGIYPGFYDEMVGAMERQWTENANKALRHFDKWRAANEIRVMHEPDGGETPSAEWREAVGNDTETVARIGRVADIIVTARPGRRHEERYEAGFEAALFDTGRPVLLVPGTDHPTFTEGKVIVAWNGSAEASRAVAVALPLLRRAKEVMVFTVAEGDTEPNAASEMVAYLKWHGVRASVVGPEGGKAGSVQETLMATTKKAKANLIVMGAYTHSRVRELLFGGVTRHVLSHANVPVLMAH